MNRWVLITFGAVAAIALGVAVVPSGLEQAFMSLRDRQYPQATRGFEARWQSGERSREVANALSELYLREGNPTKAAEILSLYVAAHPDDQPALRRLAEIFRDDQQRLKFISTLETLWKKNRDVEVLRTLAKLYELADREDDQLNALRLLTTSASAQLNDFESLGSLLAARDPKAAISTYQAAFKKWPKLVGNDTAQSFTALVTENDRQDLVRTVIFPWLAAQPGYAAVEGIATTLTARRMAKEALEATLASGALSSADPLAIVLAARLESRLLHHDSAFNRLEALRLAGKLPRKGDDVYVETAIQTQHRELALDHVLDKGPENLPFWLQTWMVSKALEANDTKFLSDLQSKTGGTPASGKFLLARIALALGNKKQALELASEAEKSASDVSSGIAVASLYADLGQVEQAKRLLILHAPDPGHVPLDDLAQAIGVALTVKDEARSLSLAQALRQARPDQSADILYARALGMNGKTSQALSILDEVEPWSDAKDFAVFEVLKTGGNQRELQAMLMLRMVAEDATLAQRTNYSFMLNDFPSLEAPVSKDVVDQIADDLDQPEIKNAPRLSRIELLSKVSPQRALPYARDIAEADPEANAYLLLSIYKRLGLKRDAIAYLASAIGDLSSDKTRQDFLHEWISLGITKEALPYLKTFAARDDREWFFAYDEALSKFGEQETRIEFLSSYARRPNLDAAFKSQLASEILESGAKDIAITLFKEEASSAPPNSSAVEQLLYLWGPRPPADGVAWLSSRALNASRQERTAWLDRLTQIGAEDKVIEIASAAYASGDRSVTTRLATALAHRKAKTELRILLNTESSQSADTASTVSLAMAAEEAGLSNEASLLFERAATKDAKYLSDAGRNAAYAGQQSRAITLLRKAILLPAPDVEAFFLLAEGLRATGEENEATSLYLRCLSEGKKAKAAQGKRFELLSLMRLGRFEEAQAIASVSNDPTIRTEYASALVDAGKLHQAAEVIAQQAGH